MANSNTSKFIDLLAMPVFSSRKISRQILLVLPLVFGFSAEAVAATCNGLTVTVDIGNGETTTSGDDVVQGTAGADIINGQGGNDTICGLGGADTINAGRGDDWVDAGDGDDIVLGAVGNDTVSGGSGADNLQGGTGSDTLLGDDGDDVIFGNSGNDTLHGGGGVDRIVGGSGDDEISTGSGATVGSGTEVDGGAGNDTITGGADADQIRGSTGNDTILGAGGDDRLFGGGGLDTLWGQAGNDFIRGNGASDDIDGGAGDDFLDGGAGNDSLSGGSGEDSIEGSTGNDELYGESENDSLRGGGGNDLIYGEAGADVLYGGGGNDLLDGGNGSPDFCDGETGLDEITETCEMPSIPVFPFIDDFELVFADEFNGSELDAGKWATSLLWGPYLPINGEEQLYVDTLGMHSGYSAYSPFEVSAGTLKITATAVDENLAPPPRPLPPNGPPVFPSTWRPYTWAEYQYNGPVTDPDTGLVTDPGYQESDVNYLSGIITSYDSYKFTHGYVEARAKVPAGRGLWPAFWTLPIHYVEDVPEIDVMEFLGQDVDRVYHTYHYFNIANNYEKISTPSFTTIAQDWTDQFHVYGMAWSPKEIIWYVDGVETVRVDSSQYRITGQSMYLLANLAVGGNWPGSPDASTVFPATFELDYIRAYKKKLSSSLNLSADFQLMFNDEFNGTELDSSKWNTHFLWGPYLPINNEEQYYVDALGSDGDAGAQSPFSLANGVLSIVAREAADPAGYPIPPELPGLNDPIWTDYSQFQRNQGYAPQNYTSGMITSYDAFKFSHGYAEIRAKIPNGDGLWPAFWLLNGYYVAQQPEIDIMEVRGENPHQIVHSYHRNDSGGMIQSDSFTTDSGEPIIGYADDFHSYGARWEPGKITWYIDRQEVATYEGDDVGYQLMYVIANLAVGGDFNFSPVDTSLFPTSFDIDYIRVYQEKGLP